MSNKVVLAYSGGLDTTYCAVYLRKVRNFEIHALTVNTGGFSPAEIRQIADRAKNLGVASFECVDVTKEYYESCIKYLIFGNVLKNATYPLSVSAERMVQAIAVANHVKQTGATAVAHGSTGAGNDQVRFDMVFQSILPGVEIITPIRDLRLHWQRKRSHARGRMGWRSMQKKQNIVSIKVCGVRRSAERKP